MQEKVLFEYAVIRLVPKVEREEFINVGVILYCAKQKYLDCLFFVDAVKISALFPGCDVVAVGLHLDAFKQICKGGIDGGPIGMLDLPSRFRWLTATRSTIVQSSKVHPGLCVDAFAKLSKLFEELVL